MAANIYDWSRTAGDNDNADTGINWLEGQAPSSVNDSARTMMKRLADLVYDLGGSNDAGGTADALTLTAGAGFAAYANGQVICFKATAANTGAATLNVNSIGAKAIRYLDTSGDAALAANMIVDNGIYVVRYSADANSAAGGWLLLNPTALPASVATLTGTQTLTNKTLTSPTITGPALAYGAAEDFIEAEKWTPPTTNGAQGGIRILATNGHALFYYAFDTTTQETLWCKWLPKKRYDGGTITFAPIWTAESGSGTVKFDLAAVAVSNDDALDAAPGTAQGSTDTLLTAGDNHTGPTSSAITVAGTFADGDYVWLKLTRDVATDTLAVDAQFLGLKIFYTTDQGNDA